MFWSFMGCVLTVFSWVIIVTIWAGMAKVAVNEDPANAPWWARPVAAKFWNEAFGFLFFLLIMSVVLGFFALIGYGAIILPYQLLTGG